jgi:hypothetical protein
VLIEFDGPGRPIIVDRPLYRELVKGAIKRTHDELLAKAEAAAKEKQTARAGKAPADPVTLAKRERDAQLRELTDQAHGANSDLGHALVHNLAVVDPADMDVARAFVLCGHPQKTNYADRLTMRISRCRTRGNGDEASRGSAKSTQRSCLSRGGAGRAPARLDRPASRGHGTAHTGGSRSAEGPCLNGRDDACGVVNTLAIADEAVANGQRPGAAALRPQRQSSAPEPRRPLA